jgi:hypothetical protein
VRFRVTLRPAILSSVALLVAAGVPIVLTAHLHPTTLFVVLAYLGWGVVSLLTSAHAADQHVGFVLGAASVLSLLAFFVPVGLIWRLTRSRPGVTRTAVLCLWGLAYLAFLYFAFPALASTRAAV